MDTPKSKITKVKMSYIAFLFVFLTMSAGCGIVNDVFEAVNGGNLSIFNSPTIPVVKITSPSSGESNVPLNRTIVVYFNKPMDKNSVEGAFSISPLVNGMFMWDSSGRSMAFDPDTGLDPLKFYTVTISTEAKDTEGNAMAVNYVWGFFTGSGIDSTPPNVVSEFPADGSIDVGIGSNISITFDESMEQTSINTGTFIVKDESAVNISGNISYIGTTATFNPDNTLSLDHTYSVTVTTGVKDTAGNGLTGDHIWSFTTLATGDTTPPIINFVDPVNSMGDVPITTNITVSFSEPMDKPSAESAFKLFEDSIQVNGTFSWTGDTMFFNPAGDLKYNASCTIDISTGAKDTAGNQLTDFFSSGFSTGPFQIVLVGEAAESQYEDFGDSDWRVKKLDSAKIEDTVSWDKTFGDSHRDYPTSSAVDSNGDIYIAGIYDGLMGNGEEVQVMVRGDSSGDLNGTYFVISLIRKPGEPVESYYVWYQVDMHPYANPYIPGMQGIEIYIFENDPADTVASRTRDQLNHYQGVSATSAADMVMISMHAFVDVTDAYDGGTGFSIATIQDGSGVYDYQWWIKKFDSNGNEDMTNWDKRITVGTEPDGVMDDFAPVTVVTDSNNNVYVAGWVWNGIGTFFDWMIKKYDSDGNEYTANWNKIFTGNGFWDFPTGMAVDSSDNLYVIGSFHNDPLLQGKEDVEWWIKKFDPNGNEDMAYWNKIFEGGHDFIDAPMAVAVDSSDNVYVAGVFADGPIGTPEITDINCADDMAGSLNGTYFILDSPHDSVYVYYDVGNTFPDPAIAGKRGIRVPLSMNDTAVIVAMATESALNMGFHECIITRNVEMITVENDRPGDVEDADMYGNPPGFSISIAQGVNSGNADWEIKKYDRDGMELANAVVDYNTGGDGLDNSPTDIAFDSAGNVYVAGYKRSSISPEYYSREWVIKKFNPDLAEDKSNWDKVITGNWGGYASSVIVDPEDNVFVSGNLMNESWSNNGDTDWVVKKFLSNGTEERSGSTGDEILDSWWSYDSGMHDDGVSMVLP